MSGIREGEREADLFFDSPLASSNVIGVIKDGSGRW